MKAEDFRPMFLAECTDHLRTLSDFVEGLGGPTQSAADVDDAFRAIHSIKGGAGMFGLDRLVPLTHALESLLDSSRHADGVDADKATALVKGVDCLTDLIEAESKGFSLPPGFENIALERLARFDLAPAAVADSASGADEAPKPLRREYHIAFTPGRNILRRANEPLLLIRELREIGELRVVGDSSAVPELTALDPLDCHLAWRFKLLTDRDIADVRAIFEFVEGDGTLDIRDVGVEGEASDVLAVEQAAAVPAPAIVAAEPAPVVAVAASVTVSADDVPAAPAATVPSDPKAVDAGPSTIRVETEKIDRLVNLVGEIAISQALVTQLIDQSLFNANPRLFQELSQLLVHTQTLHDSVMSVRAQPVRNIFQRMTRLVRELAEQVDKKIVLRISGEATEIDKTVVEHLADPIVHMLRNAADHGLESAEERLRAGKPAEGIITLHAEQRGSRIIIQVSDDGRGLDRERIRQKAIARNLIAADAQLSPDEIDNLVFLPGFSTTDQVTLLSGRGVGLDVVKQNIQKFGGRVSIRSVPGQGSSITLALPLTLAVLEGMIVRCAEESYVIPVASISECRTGWQKECRAVPGVGNVLDVRGRIIVVHDLRRAFGLPPETSRKNESVAVVFETENQGLAALVVDEISGQQQVVVKKLTGHIAQSPGVAGATILGDGRVALILDPAEIAEQAGLSPHSSPAGGTPDARRQAA